MKNKNINFHQTFYPNFDYVGKILSIASESELFSIEEISQMTGIPTGASSGKVVPHIQYSEYMNLIESENFDGKMSLKRTALGELISSEDPYFSEDISRMICHMFLTSPEIGSGLWFFVFRVLQNRYGGKVKKDVTEHDIVECFKKGTKMSAFNTSYTNENSFGNLNLVTIYDDCIRFDAFSYEDEFFYAILYVLFAELKNVDLNRSEFTTVELFNELKWNWSLNWSEKRTMEFLEKASEEGWIDLNRQLNPTTIILKRSINEVMSKIYSELI